MKNISEDVFNETRFLKKVNKIKIEKATFREQRLFEFFTQKELEKFFKVCLSEPDLLYFLDNCFFYLKYSYNYPDSFFINVINEVENPNITYAYQDLIQIFSKDFITKHLKKGSFKKFLEEEKTEFKYYFFEGYAFIYDLLTKKDFEFIYGSELSPKNHVDYMYLAHLMTPQELLYCANKSNWFIAHNYKKLPVSFLINFKKSNKFKNFLEEPLSKTFILQDFFKYLESIHRNSLDFMVNLQ